MNAKEISTATIEQLEERKEFLQSFALTQILRGNGSGAATRLASSELQSIFAELESRSSK